MTGSRRGGLAGPVSEGATAFRQRRAARGPAPDPAAPDALLAGGLLDGLAEAVVLTDAAGRVTLLNDAARQLLPGVATGCQLAMCAVPALAVAAEDGTGGFEAEHLGRQLHGRCRPLADGRSVWYVRDVTEERARTGALLAERSRTAFLAEVGSRLSLSLHPDHILRATVTLLVPYLADAAVVVRRPAAPLPVLRRRRELVDLATRIADPSDEELDNVAAEVGHLVDALAAAVRVGDPALVTEFVRWQGDVLTARGCPSELLDAVLDGWATVLVEHPQARDYLDRARTASRVPT